MQNNIANSPSRIHKIVEIDSFINSDRFSLQELFQKILAAALFCTDGESSSIMLRDQNNGELHFEKVVGIDNVDLTNITVKAGEGIAGWVLRHNHSLVVNDINQNRHFFPQISRLIGYKTHNILAVPIRVRNELIGVMEVVNKNDPFSSEDRRWTEILANQAGLSIMCSGNTSREWAGVGSPSSPVESLVYESDLMKNLMKVIKKVAVTEASVFIGGESGVGKEHIAEQIHNFSSRAKGPLIKINCPSLPEMLLESELFGHVKGAFTDAVKFRQGKLEIARGGSLFLDEIADISLSVQAKLLRVLEDKRYEPLGSNQMNTADVRIITASNKNLEQEVQKGTFREDLFYRLNIIPIIVPPLRDRSEDIPPLAQHFLRVLNLRAGKNITGFSSEAFEQILNYSWPGNIRELRNSIERAITLCSGTIILPENLLLHGHNFKKNFYSGRNLKHSLNLFKKHFIRSTLLEFDWNQTRAAEKLEIQRTYLARLIKELEIERSDGG